MLSLSMKIVSTCKFILSKSIHGNVCFSNCRVLIYILAFSHKAREDGEANN